MAIDARFLSADISEYLLDLQRLHEYLELFAPAAGPAIVEFQPLQGYPGTVMVIAGSGFAEHRHDNLVTVGGQSALVVDATTDRLLVITSPRTKTGPVEVTIGGTSVQGPCDFTVMGWPGPSTGEDGPPYSYAGVGPSRPRSAGTVPPTGVARILVVACNPTDLTPPDPTAVRSAIVDTFADVTTFYDQASYGALDVQVNVTEFVALLEDSAYYHRANGANGYPNIDNAVLDQLMAECAQGAVDQGLDLNDYAVLVASVHLPGLSVRAWGGWSASNFAYNDGAGVAIDITTAQPLGLIAQRHDADWGRAAHEFGHNVVDGGLVLGEDVYASDLVDPSEATVQDFDMMGNHDSHPLFSGFWMHQLGWYDDANVLELSWDRNPFSHEYELVAHDLTENVDSGRQHLIRIRVSDGLYYFIEVRQRPAIGSSQIFDAEIPLPMGGMPDGGVLISRAIVGELNNNQQTRLVTLLQTHERVMTSGDVAVDPLRTLRIEVLEDDVQARPRVCRVLVEWAQVIADNPGGDFDLRIEPWGPNWETVDVWIDRDPFGTWDSTDAAGDPVGNGDNPRPLEINRFEARIRNDGVADATNVLVTHYAIQPPGVGDNGNWSPLATEVLPLVAAGGSAISRTNWVPAVGEHTCLKVAISQQLGEVTGGNNAAQENIFEFEPPASVPDPVLLTVAVRNPLDERALVRIALENVPRGYYVYFPHRWIWLAARSERRLDLLVVATADLSENDPADVALFGRVPRVYETPLDLTGRPGSWFAPIGGVLARVTPKHRSKIHLEPDPRSEGDDTVSLRGWVEPRIGDQRVRVDLTSSDRGRSTVATQTDVDGRFQVRFRIAEAERALPSRRATKGNAVAARRTHAFQAHVLGATRLAPADSNVVLLTQVASGEV